MDDLRLSQTWDRLLRMSQNRDTRVEIGSAVRAELSRRHKPIVALEGVLGLSRTAIYSRTQGRSSFTYAELVQIAEFLEMTPAELVASAQPRSAA